MDNRKVILYENLKRLIVGRISTLIAENSLDYSSDYKDEMMELDNLKGILEFGNEVWKSVHWSLGSFSPLPALFGEGEWLKEYSRTLVVLLMEKEKNQQWFESVLSEKESKINSLQSDLSTEKDKLVNMEVEKRRCCSTVNSLKNRLTDEKKKFKLEINDLVTNLNRIIDENKENFSNFSAVKEELEKAKVKMEEREEDVDKSPSEENYNTKILEKDEIIEKLLTEIEEQKVLKKRVIGGAVIVLLIGILIVTIFELKKNKKKTGGVAERLKAVVLKTTNTRVFKGSNPFASSKTWIF